MDKVKKAVKDLEEICGDKTFYYIIVADKKLDELDLKIRGNDRFLTTVLGTTMRLVMTRDDGKQLTTIKEE